MHESSARHLRSSQQAGGKHSVLSVTSVRLYRVKACVSMSPPTIHPISGGGLTFFQECEKAQKMDSLCRTMARHRSVSQPWCCTSSLVRCEVGLQRQRRRLADCLEDARHGKAAAEPWTPSLSASGLSLAVSHSCCRSILVLAGSKQGRQQHQMDPSASQPAAKGGR